MIQVDNDLLWQIYYLIYFGQKLFHYGVNQTLKVPVDQKSHATEAQLNVNFSGIIMGKTPLMRRDKYQY
tara:strand:- start:974 stop:1180 length:207 start_codon:yes stop_codon:yes gene_type:complete